MKHPSSARSEVQETLPSEIPGLTDQLRVLIDAIDELREQLQWIASNGVPRLSSPEASFVLKRMAVDPSADNWGERLKIVRSSSSETSQSENQQELAEILTELLGTTELNLDEMEEHTRRVCQQAIAVLAQRQSETASTTKSIVPGSSTPGRLF